jgi:hypothetical protein
MRLGKTGLMLAFLVVAVLWGMANESFYAPPVIPVTSLTITPTISATVVATDNGPTAGRLWIVRSLNLSTACANVGAPIQATFTVRNIGKAPLSIDQISVGIFQGLSWQAVPNANFPSASGLVLQPGEDYQFQATQTFTQAGDYFAQPMLFSAGRWSSIEGATRVWFEVDPQKIS